MTSNNFKELERIQTRLNDESLLVIEDVVRQIIFEIKTKGNQALFSLTKKFDNFDLSETNLRPQLRANPEAELVKALNLAKERIAEFHEKEFKNTSLDKGWSFTGKLGEKLGVCYLPLDSVAIYIPGGVSPLVSTVLMTAIPAKIAGVKRIVLVSPPPINPLVVYAAQISGVNEIYQMGGAQAIAALAYGTESIKPVDKIVGPGNIYVSTAKKQVFGKVGIDGIFGPSELAVLADKTANPEFIAADLLSQLEHGSGLESTLLVSLSEKLVQETKAALEKQIEALKPHKLEKLFQTIKASYEKWTALIYEADLAEAVKLINTYAPEHLEIQLDDSNLQQVLPNITNAGAIFIGNNSCESLGDYLAGPSHCLPTGRAARFSSGLQVQDFMTKTSIIDFSKIDKNAKEFKELATSVAKIARCENLEAHARAMEVRLDA